MKKYDSGSAHVVIVALLTVALISAVSFIFWQNFVNKPTTESLSSKKDMTIPEKVVSVKTTKYCAENEKLCFDYPIDWSIEKTAVDTTVSDNILIKSPDKKVYLQLTTGIGPRGIVGPTPEGPVAILNSYPAPKIGILKIISKDNTENAYVSEVVISSLEQKFIGDGPEFTTTILGYKPSLVLHNNSRLSKPGTFQALGGNVTFQSLMPSRYPGMLDSASIQFSSKLGDSGQIFKTSNEAEEEFKKEVYQQAKSILLSARYD
jgi:hypothetical protein